MTTTRTKVLAILAVSAALTGPLTACSTAGPHISKGAAAEKTVAVASDPEGCARVDTPMLDIPTSDTEPQIRIPQPGGWEPIADLGEAKVTRFGMVENPSGRVATVSLHRMPTADAQRNFDRGRAELVELFEKQGWPTELTTTPGTVCGLPAETITYDGDPALGADPATVLFVAANAYGHSYVAMVMLAYEADKPSYHRDTETILSGLQVLPPATSL